MRRRIYLRYQVVSFCLFASALLVIAAFYVQRAVIGASAMPLEALGRGAKTGRTAPRSTTPRKAASGYTIIAERNLFAPLYRRTPAPPPKRSAPRPPQRTNAARQPTRVVTTPPPTNVVAPADDRIVVTGVVSVSGVLHAWMVNERTGEKRLVPFGEEAWGYRVKGFDGDHMTLTKDGQTLRLALGARDFPQTSRALRDYDFGRSAQDDANLQTLGGSFVDGVYTFGAGQGLLMDNVGVTDNYTIELTFKFDDVTGYRKIIDFKNRTNDNGLYVYNGQLQFYGSPASGGEFQPGQEYRVRLERDSATQTVRAFINDQPAFEFTDANNDAVFESGTASFFVDDRSGGEQSSGAASRLRIWGAPGAR